MDDKSQKRLILSLFITIFILIAEVVGGIMSHSLALMSDAGHVLTDAFALGLSLVALLIMKRPSEGIKHAVIQMECADCCDNGLYCNVTAGNSHLGHSH